MKKKHNWMRWVIWFLAISFYFYEYMIRVAPSVMVPNIMKSFSIGAGTFGTITAFYLYAYAPMQLPVGILMDRFGARRLLTIALFGCGTGCLIFGLTDKILLAQFSRLLMGAGSAFAFVGLVYICSHWFPKDKLASLVGLGNSLGMLGAVSGLGPLSYAVALIGWRDTTTAMGIAGLALGVVIFFAIRQEPKNFGMNHEKTPFRGLPFAKQLAIAFDAKTEEKKKEDFWGKIVLVMKNRQTWINAVIGMFFYASTVDFAGLWGVPFLRHVYHLDKHTAGFAASLIYVGWIVGGPVIGYYSDRMMKRKPMLILFSFIAFICMSVIIFAPPMPLPLLFTLLFVGGIALSAELLVYTLAVELNPLRVKGTAIALTNFIVFLMGASLQPLVGYFLDLSWDHEIAHGIKVYAAHDYVWANSIFPLTCFLAFLFSFLLKEPGSEDKLSKNQENLTL